MRKVSFVCTFHFFPFSDMAGSCFLHIHTLARVAVSTPYPSYRTIYHHHRHHILEKLYGSGSGDFGLYISSFFLFICPLPLSFCRLRFFPLFVFFRSSLNQTGVRCGKIR